MMKFIKICMTVVCSCILFESCNKKNTRYSNFPVIPKVQELNYVQTGKCGELEFISADNKVSAQTFNLYSAEFQLEEKPNGKNGLNLQYSADYEREAYSLNINKNGIEVIASENAGFYYALQTLSQLKEIHRGIENIPIAQLTDYPRFQWRGLHLDVSRHFFGVEKIKELLDWMAFYKLNKLHWHLVDDQGWRIEIKKYPLLTSVGSIRTETNGSTYGPLFYTQDEICDIVKYAAERHIEIIPEIELPGHVTSALAAYPEFSCTQKPLSVGNTWGVYNDVYCAGNEKVYQFLEDVFAEVVELFPGQLIHIGGDECPKERWQTCPKCQQKIKQQELKNEEELQSYFIERIADYLHKKNKVVLGWDEIMMGYTPEDAVIMSWHGTECGEIAVRNGYPAVMTPSSHLYFNKYQGDMESEPLAMTGVIPLEKVYALNPMPEGLSKEQEKLVKGVQACLWTEHIKTGNQLDYMLMPRLQALSEISWTKAKNWDDFKQRLQKHYKILDEKDVNYRVAPPLGISNQVVFLDTKEISLHTEESNSKIFYSLNNKELLEYKIPFLISESSKLQMFTQTVSGKKSIIREVNLKKMSPLKAIQPQNVKGPGINVIWQLVDGELTEQDNAGPQQKMDELISARSVICTGENGIIKIETYLKVPKTAIYEFLGHPDLLEVDGINVMNCSKKSKRIFYRSQVALEKGWHKLNATYYIRDYLSIPSSKIKTELTWRTENGEWESLKPYTYID